MMPFVLAYPKGYSPSPGIPEALVGALRQCCVTRDFGVRPPLRSAPMANPGVLIPLILWQNKRHHLSMMPFVLAYPKGFEPPTDGLEGRCSIQLSYGHKMERVKGIEPSQSAWKADVLPLNYTRTHLKPWFLTEPTFDIIHRQNSLVKYFL